MQAHGREVVKREQAWVEDQLPGAHLRDLQQPALFEGKPVRLLKPFDVPPGNLRSRWLQRFDEVRTSVCFVRLYLRRHTPAQVFMGIGLGAAVVIALHGLGCF